MKAIKQIIDYLRQRGELSTGQMSELAALGLVDWDDVLLPEPAAETRAEASAAEPEEELPGLRPPGRKGRGRRRKAGELSERELCDRLTEFFAEAEPRLAGLARVARRVAPCEDWSSAAVVLRNASVEQVAEAIEKGLSPRRGTRAAGLTLGQLWDFLAEEGFRTLLPEARLQGPVGMAYRALLAAADTGNLGRRGVLLRHDEVQKVFNLRMAQRQTVRAWASLYAREPDLVGQFLRREHHWLAYWSMVILYTARRGTPGEYPPVAIHEARPDHPLPEADLLSRAWAHAAFMAPVPVLALLHAHGTRSSDSQDADLGSPGDFLCPRNWERGSHGAAIPVVPGDVPREHLETIVTNAIGMKLVLVPAGAFLMGSPYSSTSASENEKPQHQVRITRPFYLGVYPVTQAEYERVMGNNPSHFQGDPNRPVECVSWEDAQEFLHRLSELPEERGANRAYRLPSEAEWEYACRAGSTGRYLLGDDTAGLEEYGWFSTNAGNETHPIGQKKPNPWGLYDMLGNVWEWCEDWYDAGYYQVSAALDPVGPFAGSERVRRGGSWGDRPVGCPERRGVQPVIRYRSIGFRVARSA